ncbi:Bug family tripartite tricarboxylate transporter substrate binding protein [Falsiroseomonas sp.]|uniref:Bug family tripartite tricarboxylate transporter substrate binding protein n=1 Tax=Falsiroseomonas sp. TaxID=2870721 RepID=UPI003F704807
MTVIQGQDAPRTRRAVLGAALLASPALLAASRSARAQGAWPQRPVRILAPFAAGGAPDVAIRLLLPQLSQAFGQPFVVENRPGASGAVAAEAVARAAPDGHTLLLASNSVMVINPALFGDRLPYAPLRDFRPVARVARLPFFLFVPATSPARDLPGLIAQARAAREPLTYATNGNGTVGHVSTEQFRRAAGIDLIHVPYRAYPAAMGDLIAGRVAMAMADLTVFGSALAGGQLRALAAIAPERSPFLPDVPALPEHGLPALDGSVWFGLFAPAATPDEPVARLDAEVRSWLATPEAVQGLARISQQPAALDRTALAALLREDTARYAALIAEAGIRPD